MQRDSATQLDSQSCLTKPSPGKYCSPTFATEAQVPRGTAKHSDSAAQLDSQSCLTKPAPGNTVTAKGAKSFLSELKNKQLKDMCRARQLPFSGKKPMRVQRLLESESRATNEQMTEMSRMIKKHYYMSISAQDLESEIAASTWLEANKETEMTAE